MGENYFGITHQGRQRKNNEDSFLAETVYNSRYIVACVIDGVGGYTGGEIAAKLTRDAIEEEFSKQQGDITVHMISAFQKANEKIVREKEINKQHENMACVVTLAIVDIGNNKFYYAHVGDTRLYLFRDSSLVKITRDHSNVGFLEESGRLTESAAMQHPKRNEVNKALGYETQNGLAKEFIDTGESPFLPGDVILVCSDGLTDMVPAAGIVSILNTYSDLPSCGRLLIDAANDAGGKDNITVVLVRNDKLPVEHSITKPLIVKLSNTQTPGDEAINEETNYQESVSEKKKGGNCGIIAFLLILCCIFIAVSAWFFYSNLISSRRAAKNRPAETVQERNTEQEKLLFNLNNSLQNATVTLTPGLPVIISDTLLIPNDTLHIIGNGVSVTRDSSYYGPAFILSPTCKYILLDSLSFENFDVAILVANKGLHLKNVQFKNCRVSVEFQQQFSPDTLISGAQADTIFYHTDSLHK